MALPKAAVAAAVGRRGPRVVRAGAPARVIARAQAGEDPRQTGAEALQRLLWGKRPPAQDAYRQIFGRSLDLTRIEQALRSAWLGNMRALTDLGRETLDTDPHLSAVVGKRIGAVASAELVITQAAGDGIDDAKAKHYSDVCRDQVGQIPALHDRIFQLAFGLFDGRAAHENQWRFVAGPKTPFGPVNWAIADLAWIHPRRLSFGPERELRIVDQPLVNTLFAPIGVDMRRWPGKFLTLVPQLFGDYPEREGLLPRCLYWSFFKRFAARERMVLVELFGKPWRWVEFDADSAISNEGIEAAVNFAEGIAGSSWGALPRGATFKTEQLDSNTGEAHEKIIDSSDKQLSKLVLGQTGTTDAQAMGLGSTQSAVMQSEQLLIHVTDCRRVAEAFEDGVTDAIIALNFGVQELSHAPKVELVLPIKNQVGDIDRMTKALNAGIAIKVSEAYELSGFEPPEPEDPVIRMDQPPTAPGALAAPPPRPVIVYPPSEPPAPHVQEPAAREAGAPGLPGAPLAPPPATEPTSPAPEAGAPPPSPDEPSLPTMVPVAASAKSRAGATFQIELMIRHEHGKYVVYSHDGTKKLGEYDTREEADERLKQVERFKHAAALIDQGVEWPTFIAASGGSGLIAGTLIDAVRSAVAGRWTHPEVTHGQNVCLARQPETVYGSPEEVIDRGVREGARNMRRMAEQLIESVPESAESAPEIFRALRHGADEVVDVAPLARSLERRLLSGVMLGALDSHFERTEEIQISLPTFASRGELERLLLGSDDEESIRVLLGVDDALPAQPRFAALPYDTAARFFKTKQVLPKATFERLAAGAKRRAFTIAGLQSQTLLELAHSELANMIARGASLKDFRKMMAERVESAGWTPSNPSHVETIFRTNVTQAHSVGRLKDMTQPSVMRERPYWQVRGVGDARQRETHRSVNGWVLRANDPFFERAFPGGFGYNCFLPGTPIQGRIIGASRALYAGKTVQLTTAEGRTLTVTANHPILTDRGLVPACAVREGDHAVCYRRDVKVAGIRHDEQQEAARAEDVFGALAHSGFAKTTAVRNEFHGEAARFQGQIDVVGSYGRLLIDRMAAGSEFGGQLVLAGTDATAARTSTAGELLGGSRLAANGGPSRSALPLDAGSILLDALPLRSLSLGPSARLEPSLEQVSADDLPADAKLIGELLRAGAGEVTFDQVVSVRQGDLIGHVYDFEDERGWIIADGFVCANCRCRASSLSQKQIDERGLRVRIGSEISGLPDPGFVGGGMGQMLANFS